jgi:hypothetical protein
MRTLGITILLLSVAAVVYFWLMFLDHVRHGRRDGGRDTRRPGRRPHRLDSRGRRMLLGAWLALALAVVSGLLLALP